MGGCAVFLCVALQPQDVDSCAPYHLIKQKQRQRATASAATPSASVDANPNMSGADTFAPPLLRCNTHRINSKQPHTLWSTLVLSMSTQDSCRAAAFERINSLCAGSTEYLNVTLAKLRGPLRTRN